MIAATFIEEIQLYNFRNICDQRVSLIAGVNLISGMNGQGKTNLLEAVYLLGYTKSFRTPTTREVIRWGEKEASVFGTLREADGSGAKIGVALERNSKSLFRNGEKVPALADYLGTINCVSFTPSDLLLVRGAPQLRRRFLDKHLLDLQPRLVRSLIDYQVALKSKNVLLRNRTAGGASPELSSWNRVMAKAALPIIEGRRALLSALLPLAAERYRFLSSGGEDLNLGIQSEYLRGIDELSEEKIFERFEEVAQRELDRGQAVRGPHRDDLLIELSGRDARISASQGQTRSIVLALKLASLDLIERERQRAPILLLDDVESELDSGRSARLFEAIFAGKRQVLLTGTEPRSLPGGGERGARLIVEKGTITQH